MGRDTSIVFRNSALETDAGRAIVSAEDAVGIHDAVRFALKPNKTYLFSADTGERIRFDIKGGGHEEE
jgi:hypothetical protein